YLGFFPLWILWYMLCSITVSQVIRKALNIGGM
ncbi:MAG TPA: EMC3/TMCO1 family protein, partial [Methanocorpusculum sp.]|nr:EMC3/TMCO1 family protein [Methanocorpusculum sp.]